MEETTSNWTAKDVIIFTATAAATIFGAYQVVKVAGAWIREGIEYITEEKTDEN
jgi:hypothetical protein